jgi:hypothetical protein
MNVRHGVGGEVMVRLMVDALQKYLRRRRACLMRCGSTVVTLRLRVPEAVSE